MERPPINGSEQVDSTKEIAELLGSFAELMTAISRNYQTAKMWETILNLPSDGAKEVMKESSDQIRAMIKEQYETAQQSQETMRKSLDEVAAKLRERGQGFVIEGYEEKLSVLK